MLTLHDVSRAMSGPRRLLVLSDGRVALDESLDGRGADVAETYLQLLRSGARR